MCYKVNYPDILTVLLPLFKLLIIELLCEHLRAEKGLVVKESAYLRAGDVESGCDEYCDGGDGGDVRRVATNDAGATADA